MASLIPLGLAAILDIREARQRLIGNASALLGARADQLAREIDAFNFTYRSAALVLCKVPTLPEYAKTMDPQHRLAVEGLLAALPKNNPEVWGVALLDPTGRVLVSSESKLQGKDLGFRAHVREVLSVEGSVASRTGAGGTAPVRVAEQRAELIERVQGAVHALGL